MLSFVLKNNAFGSIALKHAPIGWDDIKYTFKRSKDYTGVMKSFVVDELGFIKEGFDYIKNILSKRDITEEITLEVWKENPNTFKSELFFTGKIDFKTYSEDETTIFVNVEQSGFTMKFLNQDEVPIDILSKESLQGSGLTRFSNELIEIPLHSKVIKKSFKSVVESQYLLGFESPRLEGENLYSSIGLETVKTSELEGAYNPGLGFVLNEEDIFESIEIMEEGGYVFDIDLRYKLIGHVGNLVPDTRTQIKLCFKVNDKNPIYIYEVEEKFFAIDPENPLYPEARTGLSNRLYSQSTEELKFKETFPPLYLKKGDKVRIYFHVQKENHPISFWWVILQGSTIEITGDTRFPSTTCKGQLPFETFTRVCEAMTDRTNIFESTLLGRTDSQPFSYPKDGEASLYLCTGGKQIRKLPIDEHPLHFNFKDLFQTFDAKHNIGVGIEKRENKEVIVIEKKSYFYSNTLIADLGKVNSIKTSIAIDHYYNSIKVGYEEYENQVVNGIDEIASEAQYSTPITQVKKSYEKLAPYRADGYGIETARRLWEQPTKDSNYDKDKFTICLLRDGESYITERNQEFSYIEDVISPDTIYNGRDTPSRMLRRHGNMLTPSLLKAQGGNLKYVKGEANNKMSSKLKAEQYQVKEDADIAIADLEQPLFVPRLHEFEHPAKADLLRKIEANPYGFLKYIDKDEIEYKAYIQSVDFDPNTNKAQFKLLLKYQ